MNSCQGYCCKMNWFGNKKLTSVISEHHDCLENPVTFPFRCRNSILNILSPFTMPHSLSIWVWLVIQMLILLLGQIVKPWSQHPFLPYVCCWKHICLRTNPAPVRHVPQYPPEKSSSIFLLLFCLWDLTQVLSPSYIICHWNHLQVIAPGTENYNSILQYLSGILFSLFNIYTVLFLPQALSITNINSFNFLNSLVK